MKEVEGRRVSGGARAEERILYLVARAERAMHVQLDRQLEQFGLSITGYSVLRLLRDEPGLSASELARRSLISQQAGSRLVERLVRMELIERGDADGRKQRLRLTKKASPLLRVAEKRIGMWEERTREVLGVQMIGDLQLGLKKFLAVFEDSVKS